MKASFYSIFLGFTFAALTTLHTSVFAANKPEKSSPGSITAPIVIGLDADMSAVAVEGGVAIQRGAQIAIDEINQSGGVLGSQLTLEVKDHRGNPARGIRNIKQFSAMDNLVAVLGGVHTPVVLQELEIIHENQLIYLVPWAAGTPIVDNGYSPNYVFRVSVRDAEAAKVMMSHAKSRGFTKVALLLERTGWGRSNEKSMTAAAKDLGITISTAVWMNWNQTSVQDEIQKITRTESQAIMLVANAPEGAVAVEEILRNDATKDLAVVSHWGLAGGNFVNRIGLDKVKQIDLAVLQTFSFSQTNGNTLSQRVFNTYRQQYAQNIEPASLPGAVGVAHAYDLVHMLKLAIDAAQTTESPAVRSALENISEYRGLVKHYNPPFSKDRHDALWAQDYIMARYNSKGHLVPITSIE